MGGVYRAEDTNLHRHVSWSLIVPKSQYGKSQKTRFIALQKCNLGATRPADTPIPIFPRSAKLLDLFYLTGAGDGDRTRDVQLGKLYNSG